MDASATSCHFNPVFPYRPELPQKQPQLPQPAPGLPPLPETWLVEFESFHSVDHEATLFGQLFREREPSPALRQRALFVLHGQGEHSGRYIHWPHYLGDTVGSMYLLDHRGHGRSSGPRGHTPDFDAYARDAASALLRYHRYLEAHAGAADLHLVGHSMGGLIALRMLLLFPDLPVQSVSLSAPMIELAFKLPKLKEMAGKLLNAVLPSLPLPSENLGDLISRDPAVREHYKRDRLNHGFASSAFYFSYLEAKEDLWKRAAAIEQPLLLLLPLADRVIDPEPTRQFFAKISSPDKKLITYPALYHEIFNEPEKDQVFSDLKSWLQRHQK